MLDQIEFANVLILSKTNLIPGSAERRERATREIEAMLKKLNPGAKVIVPAEPNFADLPLADICNTGMFDMEEASASAGWAQEMAKFRSYQDGAARGHVPETEEYGVSSVAFQRQPPAAQPAAQPAALQQTAL